MQKKLNKVLVLSAYGTKLKTPQVYILSSIVHHSLSSYTLMMQPRNSVNFIVKYLRSLGLWFNFTEEFSREIMEHSWFFFSFTYVSITGY